jgi:hypothetical protein
MNKVTCKKVTPGRYNLEVLGYKFEIESHYDAGHTQWVLWNANNCTPIATETKSAIVWILKESSPEYVKRINDAESWDRW